MHFDERNRWFCTVSSEMRTLTRAVQQEYRASKRSASVSSRHVELPTPLLCVSTTAVLAYCCRDRVETQPSFEFFRGFSAGNGRHATQEDKGTDDCGRPLIKKTSRRTLGNFFFEIYPR